MTRRSIAVLAAVFIALMSLVACERSNEPKLVYSEDFQSGALGDEWQKEGGDWRVENGMLVSKNALNKDLVLTKPLPEEGIIEVDMISHSPQVDIKFRAWGDKRQDMHDGAYHFILGGWKNKISTIAPLGEHDKRRVEKRPTELKPNTWYKLKVTRKNGAITMNVNGEPYLSYKDSEPLDYAHFKYFSFANWQTDCAFDNLRIYSLD